MSYTQAIRTASRLVLFAIVLVAGLVPPATAQRLNVVTTLPTYAAIAREITGDRADVRAIARGDEDPHFVNPRPSYAALLQRADLFVTTGLDLELWVPGLLDRANNRRVNEGNPGHVVAYAGITLLDIPENVSRTGGDVHVFGNPHVHTDPINAIIIARNITAGLRRVDPEGATTYDANLKDFEQRILERLFGAEFIEILGAETVFRLAKDHTLWNFAQQQTLRDRPLIDYLGGWMAEAKPFRDKRMVCYHKNWAYFSARFRIPCAQYIEPKPGIPPSPGHVADVIAFMRDQNIQVLFAANYFSRSQVERVASRTGARAVMVPEHVDGEARISDYFTLIDTWIERLNAAFTQAGAE